MPHRSYDTYQVRADERLTASEPELPYAQKADADADNSQDLVGGHDGLLGQPVQTFRRHALGASKVRDDACFCFLRRKASLSLSSSVPPHDSGGTESCNPSYFGWCLFSRG